MQDTTLISEKESRRGRPPLEADARKVFSLRFRVSISEMEKLDLASHLCAFESRSSWAISRLMVLADSVIWHSGIDPSDSNAVRNSLKQIEKPG